MASNTKGMERWQEIQKKYEESQDVINKQLSAIDQLNQKISALKDINNQLEYTWGQKYQDDIAKKVTQLDCLKAGHVVDLQKIEVDSQAEIKKLKLQFRDDIIIIDKELTKQISLKKQALSQIEGLQKQN